MDQTKMLAFKLCRKKLRLGKLDQKMTEAFVATSKLAERNKLYMRDAAYVISVSRVVEACRARGWI